MKKLLLFLLGFTTNPSRQFKKLNSHYSAEYYSIVRHPQIHRAIFPDLQVVLLFDQSDNFVFLSHKNELLFMQKHVGQFEMFVAFCEDLTEESLTYFCEEFYYAFNFKEPKTFIDFINAKLHVPQLKVAKSAS